MKGQLFDSYKFIIINDIFFIKKKHAIDVGPNCIFKKALQIDFKMKFDPTTYENRQPPWNRNNKIHLKDVF